MVLSYFYILEHTQRIFRENCRGTIQGHQVRSQRVAVNTHETDRKSGCLFAGQTRLKQSYHALLSLPSAEQKNIRLPCPIDVQLVSRNQWNATPGEERRSEDGCGGRRNATERALPPEGGDG